jgi:hypothetical protein
MGGTLDGLTPGTCIAVNLTLNGKTSSITDNFEGPNIVELKPSNSIFFVNTNGLFNIFEEAIME